MLRNIFRSLTMLHNDLPIGLRVIFWVLLAVLFIWLIF